jgi:hypothetical protein
MTTTASEPSAPVAHVLSALAAELVLAQAQCVRLDGALGQLLDGAAAEQRMSVMRELHTVDLLNQQIAAIAGFLGHLSEGASDDLIPVGQALGAITLGEVAQRIGRSVGHAPASACEADEDVDFF